MTPLEVVDLLNDKLHGENAEFEQNFMHCFVYTKHNYVDAISLDIVLKNSVIKIELWDSENSQQVFIDKTNEYEPLEKTIIREYKVVVNELIKLKQFIK
jgi:hypothetical protein